MDQQQIARLREALAPIVAAMRSDSSRYKSHPLGYEDSVLSWRVDEWADEIEAALKGEQEKGGEAEWKNCDCAHVRWHQDGERLVCECGAPKGRAAEATAPCQHQLRREAHKCRHGLHMGTTCRDCILTCPQCWDMYSSSASYGPRPHKAAPQAGEEPR